MYSPRARTHLSQSLKTTLQSPPAATARALLSLAQVPTTWPLARRVYLAERSSHPALHAKAIRRVAARDPDLSYGVEEGETDGVADEDLRQEALVFFRLLVDYHAMNPGAEILARVLAVQPRVRRRRCSTPVGASPLSEVVTAGELEGEGQGETRKEEGGRLSVLDLWDLSVRDGAQKRKALPDRRPGDLAEDDLVDCKRMRLQPSPEIKRECEAGPECEKENRKEIKRIDTTAWRRRRAENLRAERIKLARAAG